MFSLFPRNMNAVDLIILPKLRIVMVLGLWVRTGKALGKADQREAGGGGAGHLVLVGGAAVFNTNRQVTAL